MKKALRVFFILLMVGISFNADAKNPDVVVNKKGGVLGHYDRVEHTPHSENGQLTHNLNCQDPGWIRCKFSTAVTVGLVIMSEEVLEDIYGTIDAAIDNSQTSGTFFAVNDQLEVEWNVDLTSETHINIYNNQ